MTFFRSGQTLALLGVVALSTVVQAVGIDGALYVCDSSGDRVVRLVDRNGSGFVELDAPGEITVFYDDLSAGPDLSNPSHMAAGPAGSLLLLDGGTLDAVFRLDDKNRDGDAQDEGEISVFYDVSAGGPKLSTANTLVAAPDGSYYVSDDGSGAHRILKLKDVNSDGDALDPDEAKIVYDASALSLPVLDDMESLAVAPDGAVFVGDTKLQAIFRLADLTGDGDFLDEGELKLFHQTAGDLLLADIDSLALDSGAVLACDNDTGRILRLLDKNGDGDAADDGEATLWLDATSSVKVGSVNDLLIVPGFGALVLDNTKDAVVALVDASSDGDVIDAGESYRWLVDDGSTFATPSGIVLLPLSEEPPPLPEFLRGDSTGDGKLDISDPVTTLGYLFLGKTASPCIDTLDADDSGVVNISDPIYALNYLFAGGAAPPAPFPQPGPDLTADTLNC